MDRLKNYGLWVAVSSLILMILQDAGIPITPEKYQAYSDIVFTILILLGIISNPSSGKGFKDKEEGK
jgi:uncharacterized membrane protein